MNGIIHCAFAGVISKQPELKTSKAGKAWCAVNMRIGEGETVQWAQVAVFGESAELAASLEKGDHLYVEGTLQLRTWKTDAGEQRAGLNIAARRVEVLGQIGRPRPSRPESRGAHRTEDGSNGQRPHPTPGARSRFDDEVPF